MAFAFNDDRSKASVYTKAEEDAHRKDVQDALDALDRKVDEAEPPIASKQAVGTVKPGDTLTVQQDGTVDVKQGLYESAGAASAAIASLPSWSRQESKPTYTAAEVGAATMEQVQSAIGEAMSSVAHHRGVVPATADLPATGNAPADIWHVNATGAEWYWDGEKWVEYGTPIDLSGYALKADLASTTADGLMSSADKVKLDGVANGAQPHIAPTYAEVISAIGYAPSPTDTTYSDATAETHGLMSADDKAKLDTVERNANAYVHPASTAQAAGFVKVGRDALGHTILGDSVTKADVTALGIPGQDTVYDAATASTAGLMSAEDKAKLNGFLSAGSYYNKSEVDMALGTKADSSTTYTKSEVDAKLSALIDLDGEAY